MEIAILATVIGVGAFVFFLIAIYQQPA